MEDIEKDDIPVVEETTINPYTELDPDLGKEEFKKSIFLDRGCDKCPQAYSTINKTEMDSCCKMNVQNWMKNIKKPFRENNFDCVEVRFKGNRKDYFRLPDGLEVCEGDVVAVEGNPGHDIGIVTLTGELCRIQMKKKRIDSNSEQIKRLYRRVKPSDIEKWVESLEREDNTLKKTKEIVRNLSLNMKINDVEFQGDNMKAIFYYTAEERVDFRNLIKVLAEEFKVRVEMKQIGARQEAARLGGIGTCGRELCCCTWMNSFQSVNTNTARVQQLPANPQKLAGQCGKLKCCLNYEYDVYVDAMKDFPNTDIELKTKKGIAVHHKTDVFQNLMWYGYKNSSELFTLPVKAVKEIQKRNQTGKEVEKLEDFAIDLEKKKKEE